MIPPSQARALSMQLDAVRFDTLRPRPIVRNVYDATSCFITRTNRAGSHMIRFSDGDVTDGQKVSSRYRAVRRVLDALLKIASRFSVD